MKLKYRLLLGFGGLILIFIGMIAANLIFLSRTSTDIQNIVEQKFTTEKTIQESSLIIMQIHAEIWDTMLFRIDERREAIDILDQHAKTFYRNIRDLTEKIPEEESNLQQLAINFQAYYQFGSTILNMNDIQEFKSRMDVVNKFRENKDMLNRLLDRTVGASSLSFETSLYNLNQSFTMAGWLMGFFALAVTLLAVLFSFVIAGKLTRPIEHLTQTALNIAEGDYHMRVEDEMKGELKTLAETFNLMTDRLTLTLSNLKDEIEVRTKAEEELRKARNYLNNVFNSLSSVLISVNRQGEITQWNSAAEKETGIKPDDALAKKVWEVIPFLKKYKDTFADVLDDRKPLFLYRETLQNGHKRYLDISLHPLVYNGSSGVVIRLDDVTEIEKKDEQLRQVQRMDTVRILAGGLAHDFNNILAAIIGTISLLKYHMEKGNLQPAYLSEAVSTIETSAIRASEMVKNLLTLSRKQELSFTMSDLNVIIENVIKMCRSTFDKSVEIQVSYYPEPATIKSDSAQMEEVLLNLCINAWHAMTLMRQDGERHVGVMSVYLEKIYADNTFCTAHPNCVVGNYWLIRIHDTGVGMSRETITHIYDPFFTRKEKGKGTGLGLAIAYSIIQLHHGFIDVYSEEGLGSEFKIYLPFYEEKRKIIKEADQTVSIGTGLIMIIDDEEPIRKMASNILEECGYRVLCAESGEEGIHIFQDNKDRINLILLDMAMPKMSGHETYLELKKIKPDVKVLLESGFKQDLRIRETIKAGAIGVIQKPFTMVELSRRIKEILI